jgi:hypothetical protein
MIRNRKKAEYHDYALFGLRVRSELELPELHPAIGKGAADVVIRLGQSGASDDERGLQAANGALLFVTPDVAAYRISNGDEIIVEPKAGAPERNVRLYLLGSAFGALLHQRGLLPLHANAIEIGERAFAFMGASGEGKSTLAAWFHDRGFQIIADDVCVVSFDEKDRAYAVPGLPRLRLWQDALEATGRESGDYERSYANDESWNKFDVPVRQTADVNGTTEIGGLYVLGRSEEFSIRRLSGVEAAEAVFANTYRGRYISAAKNEHSHWQSCVRLVQTAPIHQLCRPRDLARVDSDCERILEHAREITVESPVQR